MQRYSMDENRVLVEKDGKEVWLPQSKVESWERGQEKLKSGNLDMQKKVDETAARLEKLFGL